jgi:hypothetical protein
MNKKDTITVKGTEIMLFAKENEDYISLTDIAKYRDRENPSQIISLWLRTYSTIEYIGLWETLNNPNFNPHIYEGFKNESAKPHFWMSPQKSFSQIWKASMPCWYVRDFRRANDWCNSTALPLRR